MMKKEKGEMKSMAKSVLVRALKAAILSTIFTIAVILLLALILKTGGIDETNIPLINQIIKIVCIVVAALLAVFKAKDKFWLTGLAAGMIYIIIGYLVFSLIEGSLGGFVPLLLDLIIAGLVGAVTAIVYSLLKRRK